MIDAAKEVANHPGYPIYLLPFLGVSKTLGAIAILIPLSGILLLTVSYIFRGKVKANNDGWQENIAGS